MKLYDPASLNEDDIIEGLQSGRLLQLGQFRKILVDNPFILHDNSKESIAATNAFIRQHALELIPFYIKSSAQPHHVIGSAALKLDNFVQDEIALIKTTTKSKEQLNTAIGQEFLPFIDSANRNAFKPVYLSYLRIRANVTDNDIKTHKNTLDGSTLLCETPEFALMNILHRLEPDMVTALYSPATLTALIEQLDFGADNLQTFSQKINDYLRQQGIRNPRAYNRQMQAFLFEHVSPDFISHKVDYHLLWYGKPAATLTRQDTLWQMDKTGSWPLPFATQLHNHSTFSYFNGMPSVLHHIMREPTDGENPRSVFEDELSHEPNCLGNIAIRRPESERFVPIAKHKYTLAQASEDHTFTGKLLDFPVFTGKTSEHKTFNDDRYQTRLSGHAMKFPVSLQHNGDDFVLCRESDEFVATHLMKYPVNANWRDIEIMEWLGMYMARASGIATPEFALIPNHGENVITQFTPEPSATTSHNPLKLSDANIVFSNALTDGFDRLNKTNIAFPNYLIERFDIAHAGDKNLYFAEDFSSLMNTPCSGKYDGSYEEVAVRLLSISDTPQRDAEQLYKLLILNPLIGNNDLHLKNLSILRQYDADGTLISSQLSPAYDVLCCNKTQNFIHGLRLNGSHNFDYDGLVGFGVNTLGFTESKCHSIIDNLINDTFRATSELMENPPSLFHNEHPEALSDLQSLLVFIGDNYRKYFQQHHPDKDVPEVKVNVNPMNFF